MQAQLYLARGKEGGLAPAHLLKSTIVFLAIALSALFLPNTAQAEWLSGNVTSAAGSRNYSLWVPASPASDAKRKAVPLVVMLHGCMQSPQDLATISGMNLVADKNNFLVVYPEQTKEANPLRCWNWFDAKHQMRDSGEPALIAAVVQQVTSTQKVDTRRVYVAGISAGAAMAVVMCVNYPDLFSGVGVMAGLEFKAGTDVGAGLSAMKQGGPDPKQQGLLAYEAMVKSPRGQTLRRMPVIVFHGEADPYLNPLNAEQVIAQWARTNDYLDDGKANDSVNADPAQSISGAVPDGHSYRRSLYNDHSGRLLLEKWLVKELGHAWSGSPTVTPFADPKGPNASAEMWRFFSETSLPASKPKAAKPKGRR